MVYLFQISLSWYTTIQVYNYCISLDSLRNIFLLFHLHIASFSSNRDTKLENNNLFADTLQLNVFIWTQMNICVLVPEVSMKITSPERTVIEGDTVSITCVSDPPPDKYMLLSSRVSQKHTAVRFSTVCSVTSHSSSSAWHHFVPHYHFIILICSSLQSQSIMESQDGKFTIQYITRHISDLICQPTWNSSNQRLQSLNATMYLTVDCESSTLSITYIFYTSHALWIKIDESEHIIQKHDSCSAKQFLTI